MLKQGIEFLFSIYYHHANMYCGVSYYQEHCLAKEVHIGDQLLNNQNNHIIFLLCLLHLLSCHHGSMNTFFPAEICVFLAISKYLIVIAP